MIQQNFTINTMQDYTIIVDFLKQNLMLEEGCIVWLSGILGTGKTTLTQYIINHYFNTQLIINSPTFTIKNNYLINNLHICHLDLYRLSSLTDIYELGWLEEIINSISFVEWPDIIFNSNLNLSYYPQIHINILQNPNNSRNINICKKI